MDRDDPAYKGQAGYTPFLLAIETEITFLDPNPNVLPRCRRRLAAMHPTTIEADVMKPLPVDGRFGLGGAKPRVHARETRVLRSGGPGRRVLC